MSSKTQLPPASVNKATQIDTRHLAAHHSPSQHTSGTHHVHPARHAMSGQRATQEHANPAAMQAGLPVPLPFIDFSHQDNSMQNRDAASSDFVHLLDTQPPVNLDMLRGEIHPAGDAQLDHWCRQLSAGTWPAGEAVSVELPLPGMGSVDIALASDVARVHMVIDTGSNDAARNWFSAQRGQEIKAKLQHYTGKTVSLDFTPASSVAAA